MDHLNSSQEIFAESEIRERARDAEALVRYEQREKELLVPAIALAKAEREEAAAARVEATEHAMQEVPDTNTDKAAQNHKDTNC